MLVNIEAQLFNWHFYGVPCVCFFLSECGFVFFFLSSTPNVYNKYVCSFDTSSYLVSHSTKIAEAKKLNTRRIKKVFSIGSDRLISMFSSENNGNE